jgi:predicted dinucleotide-binding enzyme
MVARLVLLLVCAAVVASSLAAAPQPVAQSTAAPKSPTSDDTSSSGKSDTGAEAAPATAKAQVVVVAKKPQKVILVDDTVNDAQLKQILARGYNPEVQARGNEVYYCRVEHEIGTRFEKKLCKTATQIHDDELNGKEETFRLERTGPSDR